MTPEERAWDLVRDVAELPDRSSPEDWPEAMLVTGDELHRLVVAAITEERERATDWALDMMDRGYCDMEGADSHEFAAAEAAHTTSHRTAERIASGESVPDKAQWCRDTQLEAAAIRARAVSR